RRPKIFGDGTQSRDFTHVANVVAANLLAATTPGISGRVYNLACGESLSVADLLRQICRILDRPFDPEFAPPRTGDILHSWADISEARKDLGYQVEMPLEAGLEETVRWYAAEHLRTRKNA
ncbi:MAG: NAD-dependent epimerase/dehydratase family protein, partial [Planctomycetota bacterium]|nr:NAD-dependent epimerase/dehydratase family protein [Planctomycetota bacterium]